MKRYTTKDFLSNILWALKWVYSFSKGDTILLAISQILRSFTPIIYSFIFANIITVIGKLLFEDSTSTTSLQPIYIWLVLYGGLEVLSSLIENFTFYLESKTRIIYSRNIQLSLYRKISSLDFAQIESSEYADKIKKATDNMNKLMDIYTKIFEVIGHIVTLVSSIAILISYSIPLTLLVTVLSIPKTVIYYRFTLLRRKLYESLIQLNRKYWFTATNLSEEKTLLEIRGNNLRDKLISYMEKSVKLRDGKEFKFDKDQSIQSSIVSIANLGDALAVYIIIVNIIEKSGVIGDLTFYGNRATAIRDLFARTMSSLIFIYDRSKTLEYVREIMEVKEDIVSGDIKLKSMEPPKVEFKNVSFKYPKSNKYVLKNVNLVIEPYDEIAVVGLNGAGKTTLLKLLLRFYDVTSGEILINGVNIKELDLSTYYEKIGILFQDYNRYPYLSIEKGLEINNTKYTKNSISDSLKFSEVYNDIEKLPKKTKHNPSKWFDNGVNLSKGQEQKLALSRIHYRNTPILILDEPTSSIDADAEFKIFNKLYKQYEDKTILIISHRFNTIRNAKKIVVIKNGTIIEQGSHKELMENNGDYAKSFKIQAEGYKS